MAGQPSSSTSGVGKKDSAAIRRKKRKSGQFGRSGEAELSRENSSDGANHEMAAVEEDGAAAVKEAANAAAQKEVVEEKSAKKAKKKKKKKGKAFSILSTFSPRMTRSRTSSKSK